MSHTIELKKVSKYYAGEDSVSMGFSRLDLDLDIGEFVAITGESGSGKSTLLNVISGLDTYEEGEMFVCGEDTTAYGTEDYELYRKTYIGNIFQDFNLINSYTVYQNIEAVMLLCGRKKKDCRERVLELINLVGLGEYSHTKVSKLSGGQKQRVAIARALAKDAPIIVADEPTGNLDSASAESVMDTLAKVSTDKLVVIVTHNYEQAEPYVTRKLTMHDGRIIEDKTVAPPRLSSAEAYIAEVGACGAGYDDASSYGGGVSKREGRVARAEREERAALEGVTTMHSPKPRKMRRSSELRLGVRNTFNLPTKFILLFIVYFFVSTAVLSQYATTRNSMHESELLGSNPYFTNANSDRIILKKADESSFTDADIAAAKNTDNIKSVIKNDLAIDTGVSFSLGDVYIEGSVMPLEQVDPKDITYGRMPENDYEIVIRINSASDALVSIGENGREYITQKVLLQDMNQMQTYDVGDVVRVAGIIVDYDMDDDSEYSLYGYSTIYMSDRASNELLVSMMAASSKTELNFGGTRVANDYECAVYPAENVPEGKAFILKDEAYFYSDEDENDALGKRVSVRADNRFFSSEGEYKIDKIIDSENCKQLVGMPKDEFEMFYNCIFISTEDFHKLFDKGNFQISAYMINEQLSDETLAALNEKGFTTLAIKDSLSDTTGGYNKLISMGTYGRLLLEFVILLLIAYAVIRLIMRSRNSYYSTLRILGATKRNTGNILRVELILMMIIAYSVDLAFVLLVKGGYLKQLTGYEFKSAVKLLYYLDPVDYAVLGALLLLMSLLIANRYSRHIFTRSAMKAFREEV